MTHVDEGANPSPFFETYLGRVISWNSLKWLITNGFLLSLSLILFKKYYLKFQKTEMWNFKKLKKQPTKQKK